MSTKENYKIMCWNVNGIRAIWKKGFPEWFAQEQPDILCLQETKAQPDQLGDEIKQFGDYKSYTPLNLLTHVLEVPSPKDDIDGSQVWSVYWIDNDLPRIVKYCEKDVEALANVFLRMKGYDLIAKEQIVKV